VIGARVVRLDAVASTNDVAARLAADGEPEGTAVVAAEQFAGRGRQGRVWHAPAGRNICCSVILRPARPVREWPGLSWVLAAAVACVAREAGVPGAVVKYPNDVLVAGRKIAGLLLESRTGGGGQAALVAGIGINVNPSVEDFPAELRESATSLAVLAGGQLDCEALLGRLFAQLESWYGLWAREGAAGALRRAEAEGLTTEASLAAPAGLQAPAGCAAGEGG
jgi:BirA family biotin operon repressor/biotin-[acetyl-CoA-carboxylase] ligase